MSFNNKNNHSDHQFEYPKVTPITRYVIKIIGPDLDAYFPFPDSVEETKVIPLIPKIDPPDLVA